MCRRKQLLWSTLWMLAFLVTQTQSALAVSLIDRTFDSETVGAAPAGAFVDPGSARVVIADSTTTPADPFGLAGNHSLLIADESSATLARVAFYDSIPVEGVLQGTVSFKWYDVSGAVGSYTYTARNNVNMGYTADPTTAFVSVTGSPIYLRSISNDLRIRVKNDPSDSAYTEITLIDNTFVPNTVYDVQVDFEVDAAGWGHYSVSVDGTLLENAGNSSFGFQSTMPAGSGVNQVVFAGGWSTGNAALMVDDVLFDGPSSLHPGDANGDGMVNLADLQILGDNWQSTTASWSTADFTGDGNVNLADLQILGDNWGFGVNPDLSFDEALAQVAIPEPASVALLSLGAVALLRRR